MEKQESINNQGLKILMEEGLIDETEFEEQLKKDCYKESNSILSLSFSDTIKVLKEKIDNLRFELLENSSSFNITQEMAEKTIMESIQPVEDLLDLSCKWHKNGMNSNCAIQIMVIVLVVSYLRQPFILDEILLTAIIELKKDMNSPKDALYLEDKVMQGMKTRNKWVQELEKIGIWR